MAGSPDCRDFYEDLPVRVSRCATPVVAPVTDPVFRSTPGYVEAIAAYEAGLGRTTSVEPATVVETAPREKIVFESLLPDDSL